VKEEGVFWLGGKPGKRNANEKPVAGALEPAIATACRDAGAEPEDFVAALGAGGSWLVHFERSSGRERIVWNGRDGKLILQAAIRSGGWRDVADCAVATADENGFVAGVRQLLAQRPTGA